jgi:hypothetical protein
MAKPIKTPSGYVAITEQHKWHIMVSNGKSWELYDSLYTWYGDRRYALKKLKSYHQFQRYLKNTGRRFTIKYVSVEEFNSRPLYLSPGEM